MKQILLILAITFCALTNLQAQVVEWAQTIPQCSTSYYVGQNGSRMIETGNNIILATEFYANWAENIRLTSYDRAGNIIWKKDLIAKDSSKAILQAISADANRNIYLLANSNKGFNVQGTFYPKGTCIIKLNNNGEMVWLKQLPVYPRYFAVDNQGNIFIADDFSNTLTLGNTTLIAPPAFYSDVYFAKINTSGVFDWVKQIGTSQFYERIYALNTTKAGDVLLLGQAGETAQIGAFVKQETGFFLASFESSGNVKWVKELKDVSANIIEVDSKNNIYLSSLFSVKLTLDQTTITTIPGHNNIFISKLDQNGNLIWLRKMLKTDVPNSQSWPRDFVALSKIIINKNDNVFIAGTASINIAFDNISLPVKSGVYNTFVAQLNSSGDIQWGHSIYGNDNSLGAIAIDSDRNIYLKGLYLQELQLGPYHLIDNTININSCGGGYFAKLITGLNSISGHVFVDTNNNGIKDNTEESLSEVFVAANPGPVSHTATVNGDYNIFTPAGNFNISLPNPPKYYTLNPVGHSINQAATGQTITGKDFALIPAGNKPDILVSATNITPARPGFQMAYRLVLQNNGTTPLADTLTFKYDTSRLVFDHASVPAVSHQNGKLKWTYQLLPFKKQAVTVYFTVNTNTALGDTLVAGAAAGPFTTDVFPSDNQEEVKLVVVGSYDPNDKQVRQRSFSPAQLASGEHLDYTIRFQNTGTDTAFTVIVQDTLSHQLDLSSLEMIVSSHTYSMQVFPGNKIAWRFPDILLPDSNTNEPASHGFIRFRVKAKQNLMLGEKILNRAYIYFDFNEPVITNYAETLIEQPWVEVNKQLVIYPNPARDQATLQAKLNPAAGEQEVEVRLVSLLGQLAWSAKVKAGPFLKLTLNMHHLQGFYLVQVIAGKEVLTGKLLVE